MSNLSVQYNKKRFLKAENEAIAKALAVATTAHEGQLRASGEPYIIHPIAVAETVAQWGLDYEAVMAALLHDVVEDTEITLESLSEQFGAKVAELVDGVTKLRLSSAPRPSADSARLEASNENLRKLLLATTKDYRVLLIKLADRLHNMRTLQYLPPEKRTSIARESLQIYAPLADRFGMGALKGELEDLGFRHAYPEEFVALEHQVQVTAKKAERYLAVLKQAISTHLKHGEVKVLGIEARQKHYYSIYKKLVKVEGDIDKIYDLVAVRVIVPDVAACYQALGVLHHYYKPLIYRIKDYIAVPKPNGYQSLHTTVFAEDGHITEIQIRTPQMHEEAEYGLAAHFYYDEQKISSKYVKRTGAAAVPDNLGWVKQLSALQKASGSGEEFVEGAELDLFGDRIFVFSPMGDLYELPEGATPLDFAFAVHSNIGLRAQGAKVNGRMVPLDTRLENRSVVEIVLRREPAPSRDWLSYVVTSHAKNRIRAWFRAVSHESNVATGRKILEDALRAWGVKRLEDLSKKAVSEALDSLHMRSMDDLLAQIGEGTLGATHVIHRFIPNAAKPADVAVVKRAVPTGEVLIDGKKLPHTLAPCCNPVFPQPLLGYVTRGKGVTVHALGCHNVPVDVERYATCRWGTLVAAPERLLCRVEVQAANRVGLLLDITQIIASLRLNIAGMATRHIGDKGVALGETEVSFGLEVPDLFALANLMHKLERLSGVIEVRRAD
jgi:guanosine-3',5'-bis(diphosphate) 3'-pyrophosphohydrolase